MRNNIDKFTYEINQIFFRYIPQLCDLFQMCEDLEDIEKLKLMCSIAKSLFLLNNNSLLGELLDENYFK